jgi:hypothetical protein
MIENAYKNYNFNSFFHDYNEQKKRIMHTVTMLSVGKTTL